MSNTSYNPDVLSCLANLSNDEVFTPPSLANDILNMLPTSIWQDKNAKFLDPATKSGVFLREITKRLMIGLEKEIPDEQERRNHILKNQVFGIAITELTSLLSKRSLYCSKKANGKYSVCESFDTEDGNIIFGKTDHTWKNGNCVYCGASKVVYERDDSLETHAYKFIHEKEVMKMKFDVIIGNPPYQLSDGGAQASAMPLYHKFVMQAQKLNPRFLTMIIPSRWFAGGKGLDEFREQMLKDKSIRVIHDFLDASECFPGVDIKGGVCYFLWDRDNKGDCRVFTHEGNEVISEMERPLLEKGTDTFIRYNEAISILHKVLQKKETSFSSIVMPRKPFGFPSNFMDYKSKDFTDAIKLYANQKIGYLKKEQVRVNPDWADSYKVYIPEAIGIGNMKKDILKPILGKPNTCCTETYILVGPNSTEQSAKNIISYINTKFFHFLLGLKKVTQHTTSKVYSFIPMQDFSKPWTDEELYEKYNLDQDEISFIEEMVRPLDDEKAK
jgi:site-specific DNA-methyltransferase (adenine-specific)